MKATLLMLLVSSLIGSLGQTGQDTISQVEGVVISAGDASAIVRADVWLTKDQMPNVPAYVTSTTSDGHFRFKDIPKGAYRLFVTTAGFVPKEYGRLEVALKPYPDIAGRFIMEGGEPLPENKTIVVFNNFDAGSRVIAFGAGAAKDGTFTLSNLTPGIFHLKLTGSPENYLKGSADLLILSLIAHSPLHGYEISKLIQTRSHGANSFNVVSLCPLLYRLESRGCIQGHWVEKPDKRRHHKLTAEGGKVLAAQRNVWREFVDAVALITRPERA